MSRLRIFEESQAAVPVLTTADVAQITSNLREIGVAFEQWSTDSTIQPGDSADIILDAYRRDVDRLIEANGFKTVDVVSIAPDHPEREAMRAKFLDEHFHKEDEVRFFVAGSGLFTLHVDGRVYEVLCEAGDLIAVPDSMLHWFDMGPSPSFVAIRFFTQPDGWIGHFTGTDWATKFPRYEGAPA